MIKPILFIRKAQVKLTDWFSTKVIALVSLLPFGQVRIWIRNLLSKPLGGPDLGEAIKKSVVILLHNMGSMSLS